MATYALREAGGASVRPVRTEIRVVAVVACTVIAFAFSLETLVESWRYQTPLSDLALVPVLALVLFVSAVRRYPQLGRLRLGRVDLLLAGLGIAAVTGALVVGPILWSKYFWATRIDLLMLPLFAGAAVVLLFGARGVVRFGFPLAFLLLAWPLPYLALVERSLAAFTSATVWAATQVAVPLGIAQVDPARPAVFDVAHGGDRFSVLVGSACSGVNALVGFLIVGTFASYYVRGRLHRRLLWLLLGAALVWLFNAARVVGILAVASRFGEDAAFRVLHPAAGLAALVAAGAVLVGIMRPFGLAWRSAPLHVDSPLAQAAQPEDQATPSRVGTRLLVLAGAAVLVALAAGPLREAGRGYANDGRPAVAPFTDAPTVGTRWRAARVESIGWATPYFGRHSSWVRYRLRPVRADAGAFTAWLDAVRSPDLGALNAYSLAHCYDFHDFDVGLARRVDLGNGVVGQAFVYETPRGTWHAVSWQWPVLLAGGRVEHERIVLLANTTSRPPAASAERGGFRRFLLSLFDLRAPGRDDNPALTRALTSVASDAVDSRVGGDA